MHKLAFEFQWSEAPGVNGLELSETWADLTIRAGDTVLTRVFDARTEKVRESIQVPIYPLAEWLASNWWFLNGECANPIKEADWDFYRRHSLGANREGYAFPDLQVIPAGSKTRITWTNAPHQWTKVRFLESGEIWIDGDEFREASATLIEDVLFRLEERDVGETFLSDEWDAIRDADPEEARFCETAAGLGWDPYSIDENQTELIVKLDSQLGAMLAEAIPALDSQEADQGCAAINEALSEAKNNCLFLQRIIDHRLGTSDAAPINRPPWDAGYAMARQLRDELEIVDDPLPSIKELAEALGGDPNRLRKIVEPNQALAGVPLIDAVVTVGEDRTPAFGFRKLNEQSRRFNFCRALFEVLTSWGSDSLVTRARSERQQRNRAFAAEFLAPSDGLRKRISTRIVDSDDMSELASEFGVSSHVVEHQIKNHRIAEVWT